MYRHTTTTLLNDLVHYMHSITVYIRRRLDETHVASISVWEQDYPNYYRIGAEQGLLGPVLQCNRNQEYPFTTLNVLIKNKVVKTRNLRKMLIPLKAFQVEKAKVRCLNACPVVTESWKRGYTRVIKEV